MDPAKTLMGERSDAKKLVADLFHDAQRVYLIHYACESFDKDSAAGSIKVTAIAVRNLRSAETSLWSLYKSAEILGLTDMSQANIPQLESHMLREYFAFLDKHQDCRFVHWNMRNDHYGFPAIEHRYKALGGAPFILAVDRKVDLSMLLWVLYGDDYVPDLSKSGRIGKIFSVVEINGISDKDALSGHDEARAYSNGDYLRLQRSTLRKLEIFSQILGLVYRGKLKTNANWFSSLLSHPAFLIDKIKAHWLVILFIFLGSLLSAIAAWRNAIMTFWNG
jgi:hypothetical protein